MAFIRPQIVKLIAYASQAVFNFHVPFHTEHDNTPMQNWQFDTVAAERNNQLMESNPNPYASPSIPTNTTTASPSVGDIDVDCPQLPLKFRTPTETQMILTPIGIGVGMLFLFSILLFSQEPYDQGYSQVSGPSALALAALTAVTSFGCLMAIRCKITVDHALIEIVDVKRRVIYFTEIVSWRQEDSTGTVYVTLIDQSNSTPVSNWAMTKENGTLVARVLLNKVGPPKS